METVIEAIKCPLCGSETTAQGLDAATWLPPGATAALESRHAGWRPDEGACPQCVKEAFLDLLITQANAEQHTRIQAAWPLNAEAAFGVLPTGIRLHIDRRFAGRGVTLAMVDAAFYPHPDLTLPRNRIKAWVDATEEPVQVLEYQPEDKPEWPGWDSNDPAQWHGLMTTTVAAGNGWLSYGLYEGPANEADLVLVQVMGKDGCIGNERIERALRWLEENGERLGVRIVNLSVAGREEGREGWEAGDAIDEAITSLVGQGITVVTAAGNDGERHLVPPATSPAALTIGGLDDNNNFSPAEVAVWHSNYGASVADQLKPELVAPSIWVVAPVLPGSEVAAEASKLFALRHLRDVELEARIAEQKFVTPHYQHVEGTSFAAPLVSSFIACMLEATPTLTPDRIRRILVDTAQPVDGSDMERQGAGALTPCKALGTTLREPGAPLEGLPLSPHITEQGTDFYLYEPNAAQVHVQGSWDDWSVPGVEAAQIKPGIWHAHLEPQEPASFLYRFVIDGVDMMDDPDNPAKSPDKHGGFSSIRE